MPDNQSPKKAAPESSSLDLVAELQGIRLRALAVEPGSDTHEPPYDLNVVITPSAAEVKASGLNYQVDYVLVVEKGSDSVLSITCTYQALYGLPPEGQYDPEDVQSFGSTSVMLTLYPYFRELVADLSARAGLAPVTLGPIRLSAGGARQSALLATRCRAERWRRGGELGGGQEVEVQGHDYGCYQGGGEGG